MEVTSAMVGAGLIAFVMGLAWVGTWAAISDNRAIVRKREYKEGRANTLARKVQADLARRMGQ